MHDTVIRIRQPLDRRTVRTVSSATNEMRVGMDNLNTACCVASSTSFILKIGINRNFISKFMPYPMEEERLHLQYIHG